MAGYAVACDALGAQAMIEPAIGLAVGLCLAVYLLYTLICPEKF